MTFNREFTQSYISQAPLALSLERIHECNILSRHEMPRPILDLGCGDGIFANVLFKDRVDVGVDPNQRELERASELNKYDELIQCFGDKIPKPDGYFGSAYSNSVLEHIDDLEPVLNEIWRILKTDGFFYATVPTEKFEKYSIPYQTLSIMGLSEAATRYAKFFNRFWQHHHAYTVESWKKLFEKSGFEVADSVQYGTKAECLANDVLAWFALPGFLSRKFLKRWFVFPQIRKTLASPISSLLRSPSKHENGNNFSSGGLVFFKLRKMTKN